MLTVTKLSTFAVSLAFALPILAAGPQLVVDRGLPKANLNDASGSSRSNVRWAIPNDGFLGDDFIIGAQGEKWVIDSIRTWTVPGVHGKDPVRLSDFYQDVRLYFGGATGDLTPLVSARLNDQSNRGDSGRVQISDAATPTYDDFGKSLHVWQVEFVNLNLPVDGGVKYRFGVWGMGRAIPGAAGKSYMWFNHASNAALSDAPQDGADGLILQFDATGRAAGDLNTEGHGWDKSADINVQVFAHHAQSGAGAQ
ncbi:MAG TPA: hypothetical protein VKB88_22150 [Bryobacteraceae bacterium]|nr:hypothetical protein [Bryobacteraceae bacterium]